MSFTDFLEDELLDHVFGNAAYSAPATLHVGLSSTTITDAGANITEPSTGGYARVAVTNNATNFPAASGGAKSNGTAITFPTATADWVSGANLVDFFIADDPSAGNILGYGTLAVAKPVLTDDTASFAVGELDITLT